jgi:hypothetical protein
MATPLLLYLFPFIFVCILHYVAGPRHSATARERTAFCIGVPVVVCVTTAILSMLALYTAAQTMPLETNRLHGRFYGYVYLLVIWLGLSTTGWNKLLELPFVKRVDARTGLALLWLAVIVAGVMILRTFSLYPWDSPELMPFYDFSRSTWKWSGALGWTKAAATSLLVISALAVLHRRSSVLAIISVCCGIIFVLGGVQTVRWQQEALRNFNYLELTGRFVRASLRDVPDEQLLVAGTARYGEMAYVLFGLSCRCRVVVWPRDHLVTAAQIPEGVTHVVVVGNEQVDLRAEVLLSSKNVRLFHLVPGGLSAPPR